VELIVEIIAVIGIEHHTEEYEYSLDVHNPAGAVSVPPSSNNVLVITSYLAVKKPISPAEGRCH
jgi:hypothetical protein